MNRRENHLRFPGQVFAQGQVPGEEVIFLVVKNKFYFILGADQFQVGRVHPVVHPAARAFLVEDDHGPRVDRGDRKRAVGFDQDGHPGVQEVGDQSRGFRLEEGFTAGDQNQGKSGFRNSLDDFREGRFLSAGVGVSGVAVAAAEVAAGQADQNDGIAAPGGFAQDGGGKFRRRSYKCVENFFVLVVIPGLTRNPGF